MKEKNSDQKTCQEIPVYWITSRYASQFNSLKVKEGTKILPDERKHMDPCLWFENREDAEDLLKEIKETIRKFYLDKGIPNCPIK